MVDLLPQPRADVGDIEIAGGTVERKRHGLRSPSETICGVGFGRRRRPGGACRELAHVLGAVAGSSQHSPSPSDTRDPVRARTRVGRPCAGRPAAGSTRICRAVFGTAAVPGRRSGGTRRRGCSGCGRCSRCRRGGWRAWSGWNAIEQTELAAGAWPVDVEERRALEAPVDCERGRPRTAGRDRACAAPSEGPRCGWSPARLAKTGRKRSVVAVWPEPTLRRGAARRTASRSAMTRTTSQG